MGICTETIFLRQIQESCMFWILIPPAVPFPCMILLCSAMKRIIYLHEDAFDKTVCMLEQFLKGYQRAQKPELGREGSHIDLLAVYHFQLQAT